MKVLMVGAGGGSFDIRGRQLGHAMSARVCLSPASHDVAWADLIVLVKRAIHTYGPAGRRSGKPVIWDVLDIWAQPAQNRLSEGEAVALVRALAWPGLALVGATQAMAEAIGGQYLPHHAWPGLSPAPARETVRAVAYQGNVAYLGRWAQWIADACEARGWRFLLNPPDLRDADLLVAFRDGEWDGWICREWKSGVKAVNAMAAGRPLISQDGAGRRDVSGDGSVIDTPDQLDDALDAWIAYEARASVVDRAIARVGQFSLEAVAARYRTLLEAVACPA